MSSGHVQEDYPLVGAYGENRSKWFWVGVIVFVCWNILLFSLAVAAIAKVNNIKEPQDQAPPVISQSVSMTATNLITAMSAVSLVPTGVRAGAGTTIFSHTTPTPPFDVAGSQNLKVARFIDSASIDTVIVVWTNSTGCYAVLGTLTLDKSSVRSWYTPQKMPFNAFYDVIALANNHFIVAADKSVYAGSINTNPGYMNITAISSADYPSLIMRDVRVTAMGMSNFILSYDTGIISVNNTRVHFGVLVGSVIYNFANNAPNVTILTNQATVDNGGGGFSVHDTFTLTDNTFVVVYGSTASESMDLSPKLTCSVGRFNPDAKTVTFSKTPAILDNVTPQFHLSAVKLDSETGVVFVVDGQHDNDLRAVLIHRNPNMIDGVHFGDVLSIEGGIADNIYTGTFENGAVPFIDSAPISSNKAVVAWADFSNNGALTTAIVTRDHATNLHVSPLYVVGSQLDISELLNYTVSVAGLSIPVNEQYGALIIDRKVSATTGNVALVEIAPKAFGVATHNAFSGEKLSVTVSGLVSLPSSFPTQLKPGYLYYGRTDGSLEAGPLAGTVDKSAAYITLSDGTMVSTDSVVGVAVDTHHLYVLPAFQ